MFGFHSMDLNGRMRLAKAVILAACASESVLIQIASFWVVEND